MPIEDVAFVVLRADLYDRVRTLIDGADLTIDEQRWMLSELGRSVGWDDPAMDVYNDLSEVTSSLSFKRIGSPSPTAMSQIDQCLKNALGFP